MSRTSLAPNISTIAPIQLGLDSLLKKFVVDLADTQFYSGKYSDIIKAQTQSIVENQIVSHYGDLVQQGTGSLGAREYANANVPRKVVSGNHDFLESGSFTQVYDNSNYLPNSGPQWSQFSTTSLASNINTIAPIQSRLNPLLEKFVVVGLPDTQKYSEKYPHIFKAQTQWIVDNQKQLDIRFVSHYGDLVQHGTGPLAAGEYANAKAAMDTLLNANVPHGVVPGNHDVLESGNFTQVYDNSNYLKNFGPQWYERRSWFGGASASGLSTYQTFSGGGYNFIALHLDLETPHSELAWAQGVINANRDKPVMVTTHRYLQDAQDYTGGVPLVPSGRYPDIWYNFEGHYHPNGIRANELFNNFIVTNRNIFLVNAGHFHEEYRQTNINNHGLPVHEVLADYQDDPNGGNGYLRIMEFDPARSVINFKSYSPTLNNFLTKNESQFSLNVDFNLYKAPLPTAYFQNGISGYNSTQDTWINEAAPNTSYGNNNRLVVDDDTRNNPFNDRAGQSLLRFDNIIGSLEGQIPLGATISRANLKLLLANDIDNPFFNPNFKIYHMNRSWQENSTWNSLGNGLSLGQDYNQLIGRFAGDNNPDGKNVRNIDVTAAVQRWANGEQNYGFAIISEIISRNDDGIDLFSSEANEIMFRPALEVQYTLGLTPPVNL